MRIVAFGVAHDSSVCAINNGKIEFFCKEERLSRNKRDSNPFKALDLYHSLNFGKIDHFLYTTPTNTNIEYEYFYSQYIKKKFNIELENFSSLMHHVCHATLAYYNSGFDESLVFVIDRNGSVTLLNNMPVGRESESVYVFGKQGFYPIQKSFWLEKGQDANKNIIKDELAKYFGCEILVHNYMSIVKVYEAATTLIGQHPLENGKTMGLSSYGDNEETYFPLFINNEIPISEYFTLMNDIENKTCFYGLEDCIQKDLTPSNYKLYANKAKHVQLETQKAVLKLIKKHVTATGIKNVCIVGGYGLNVVANNHYLKHLPDVNFYFEPVADDTGISIGAAVLKYKMEAKSLVEMPKDNFYHYYDSNEKIQFGKTSTVDDVCALLINQKSVAIFDGNPEAGPRALGHRSILFDPRNLNGKEIVNRIKKREWYRPFAGIILESEFEKYFETLGIKKSPYMTINFEGKQGTKDYVPAIMHVDNTCRIQTVSGGFLFELLQKFYEKTGCPMLLNTSFNLAGEALVQTKQDAIQTFENSFLDAVYFVDEEKILEK